METTDDNHNDRDHSDPIDNPPHPSEEPEHQPLINQQPTENNNNNNNPNSSHNLDNPPINNNPPSSNFPLPDSSNVNHNNNNPTNVTAQKNSLQNNSLSSLPLQMLIYFHYHYAPFFFALNLALFTYKAIKFYYPGRFLGWELTTIFLYLLLDESRLFLASKGNKTGGFSPFAYSLLLSLPLVILHAYYIGLQTYVLRVDLVINAIAFIFLGSEILLSGMMLLNLYIISRRI